MAGWSRWRESRWSAFGAALLASTLLAAAPAREAPQIHLGDPKSKLIQNLNFWWPEQRGIARGSCLVKSDDKDNPEFWLYVLLPRSQRKGFVVELQPDGSSEPVFANEGDLHVGKHGVTVQLLQGGLGTEAVFEGGAEWIIRHHLTIVPTYAQALASRPTLHCPDDMTMMAWRFGHRRHAKPDVKAH